MLIVNRLLLKINRLTVLLLSKWFITLIISVFEFIYFVLTNPLINFQNILFKPRLFLKQTTDPIY